MSEPDSEAAVAEFIRAAHDANEPLLVQGAGTKAGMLRPVQAARTLSTRALRGIVLHRPQEMIVSARAGTPMAELAEVVASGNQQVTAEPPDLGPLLGTHSEQTIGGVVATNLSGPRRIAWGATRDHVMGVRAVNGAGETIHSGGRVLKNVTGLDLCKLLTGSHGTLAVLTEVTLKVGPTPERTGTLAWRGLDPARAVAALAAALGSPFAVSGAAYLPAEAVATVPSLAWMAGSLTLARLEDFATSVAYRGDRLRADLAEFGVAEMLDDGASRMAWAAIRDAMPLVGRPGAVWRVSVRPSAGPAVAEAVAAIKGSAWFMDWGGGLVWVSAPATAEAHASVRAAATAGRGTWTLLKAPDGLRASLDVLPPEGAAQAAITSRVKAAFDPRGILNPGRMAA